jgi:putative YhbY family RNA-binding protein
MVDLTPTQRRALKARAHHLQPVVMVGEAGLTAAVIREIASNLKSHELIKIRVLSDDRQHRTTLIEEICRTVDAAPVQQIGKVLVVYRPRPDEPESSLPSPAASKKRKAKQRSKRSYQVQ